MSSPRSSSELPFSSSADEETPDSKGPMPVTNRNSWIYTPVSLPSSNTTAKDTVSNSGLQQMGSTQVDAALDLLAKFDFVDAVQLLRVKQQLSCEEAMRQLYNHFYAKNETPSRGRTTWSQHRQQRPTVAGSTSTAEVPTEQQPLQLRGRSPDTVWKHSKTTNTSQDATLSDYTKYEATQLQPTRQGQHRSGQPAMPTLPTHPVESFTRSMRGATFSNTYEIDGTALGKGLASRLNLYGGGSVGNGHHFVGNEPVERLSYNPTATTFTPTGPRQDLSRTMKNNLFGYGSVPDGTNKMLGAYSNSNQTFEKRPECFGKGLEYKTKSPTTEDVNGLDDSGLGLTPPSAEHDRTMSGVPVPVRLNQGGTEQRRFIPMNAALKSSSLSPQGPSLGFKPAPESPPNNNKFSERYLGQHTESNASANIPEDYNCAVWIRNLPPDVSYSELLGSFEGIGRIWCSYINVPDYVRHHTAAAKVVFYRPEAARALLEFVSQQNPNIRGHYFKADLNRIKSAPHPLSDGTSRVLIVTGEDWFAEKNYLMEWFAQQCQFQLDDAITHIRLHGRAVIEFRFGSYRSQAEAGFKALTINRPKGFVKVEFGDDPCEVGETLTSKSIALQRFQGIGI